MQRTYVWRWDYSKRSLDGRRSPGNHYPRHRHRRPSGDVKCRRRKPPISLPKLPGDWGKSI